MSRAQSHLGAGYATACACAAALSPLNSSKSGDRRDDRPAASSPEPADTSRRLWPHPGRVRSTRAAILTTDRLAATTAAATAAQRLEPRSRDFASSLLPFNESAAKRRRKGTPRRPIPRAATFRPKIAASRGGKILRYFLTEREAPFVSPAKTARTLASTQCFSLSVMMPASRRQLALKDMKDAEGASLIGKISSRFTGESMAVSTNRPFLLAQDELGPLAKMPPAKSSCHLYFGVGSRDSKS
jgi:hypothetical protein